MSVHTRSLKYGKLSCGSLVHVAPSLMRRLKQHFHTFDFGVRAIFGMNGAVWLAHADPNAQTSDELNDLALDAGETRPRSPRDPLRTAMFEGGRGRCARGCACLARNCARGRRAGDVDSGEPTWPTPAQRERVCRARNAVVVLDAMYVSISPVTVAEASAIPHADAHRKPRLAPRAACACSYCSRQRAVVHVAGVRRVARGWYAREGDAQPVGNGRAVPHRGAEVLRRRGERQERCRRARGCRGRARRRGAARIMLLQYSTEI